MEREPTVLPADGASRNPTWRPLERRWGWFLLLLLVAQAPCSWAQAVPVPKGGERATTLGSVSGGSGRVGADGFSSAPSGDPASESQPILDSHLTDTLENHDPLVDAPGSGTAVVPPETGGEPPVPPGPPENPFAAADTPEEKLDLAQVQAELYAGFEDHLQKTLDQTRQDLSTLDGPARELGPDSPETTATLRVFLRTGRRLERWTCSLLALMFSGSTGPSEAGGLLYGLEANARPRHVYFDVADLRLEAALLEKKLSRTTQRRKAVTQEINRLQGLLPNNP